MSRTSAGIFTAVLALGIVPAAMAVATEAKPKPGPMSAIRFVGWDASADTSGDAGGNASADATADANAGAGTDAGADVAGEAAVEAGADAGPLVVTPEAASVAPLGTIALAATGGSGSGYKFALTTNGSGATVDPASGAYQAGATGNTTDVVTLTDDAGDTDTATITVTAALAAVPAGATVAPRDHLFINATGGNTSMPYTFALTTNNSGGSLTTGGDYRAGATPGAIDTVTIDDANGAAATCTLTVGPGVTLLPSQPSVPPLSTIAFMATGGGHGGYTFSLAVNRSGATINTQSGVYLAGATGGMHDVVAVVDALGNAAQTQVSVGLGVTLTPAMSTVAPGGAVHFVAGGGSGAGYRFRLVADGSGATVDATSGAYLAGAKGGVTDIVGVIDSLANAATATVVVSASADGGAPSDGGATVDGGALPDGAPGPGAVDEAGAAGSGEGDAAGAAGSDDGGAVAAASGGGCATAASAPGGGPGAALGVVVGIGLVLASRRRRRRR